MATVNISGTDYEVYGDLANANTYFAGALNNDGWTAASFGDKNKALVSATRMFDRTFWVGASTLPMSKTVPQPAGTQPLLWPRTGVVDCGGLAVPDDVIPEDIVAGSFELANALLGDTNDTIETTPNSGSNLRSDMLREKVDVLETETAQEFFQPTLNTATRYPTQVHEYIRCYLSAGRGGSLVVATGLCDDSSFDDDFTFNPYGLP